MLRKIWQNLRGLRPLLLLMLVITLLDAALSAFSISLILPVVNTALGNVGDQSWVTRHLPSDFQAQTSTILMLLGGVLGLKLLVSIVRVSYSIHLTENIRLTWQLALSRKFILRSYSSTVNEKKGRLVNDLIYEADTAASFIYNYLNYLAQIFIISAVLILLISVNGPWVVYFVLAGVLLWYFLGRPYFKLARRLGKHGITLNQNLNAILYESLTSIKDIKILRSEDFQLQKIKLLGTQTNTNRKAKKIAHAIPALGKEFILAGAVILIAFILPDDIDEVKDIMPQIALFIAATSRLTANVSTIISLRFKITSQFPSFKLILARLENLIDQEEDLYKGKVIRSLNKYIEIKNLFFDFNKDAQVLKGLNIHIEKGLTTCIMGASGAGKTTLIDILTRIYEPTAGTIKNGTTAITKYSLSSWRQTVGYVPQEPMIYHGTIRENICLGNKKISQRQIDEACKVCLVDEFVNNLPERYETLLNEGGANLSGGQKKRLAMARVIAQGRKLIILDETTSAIEETAEQRIIKNLKKKNDITLLIITHRKSTLKFADKCYFIRDGKAFLEF